MKTVRYKGGPRRGDPDRHSFAFFAVGAMVVIAVAFFLGLQVGRVVEKNATTGRRTEIGPARGTHGDNSDPRGAPASDIRKEISSFSEDAVKIPAVPPAAVLPSAREELRKTEASATAPEALSRKDPPPRLLDRSEGTGNAGAQVSVGGRFTLQAGAMKRRGTADALRNRLEKAGYKAKVVRAVSRTRGEIYRVRVGPFRTREAASRARKGIRAELKIDVFLLQG